MSTLPPAGGAGFFWSVSWPELELSYLSPSALNALSSGQTEEGAQGSILAAKWAASVLLQGQLTEQTLIAELWNRGWSEFDLDFDPPGRPNPLRFRCRASVVRDSGGRPTHIEGIAVPRHSSDERPGRPGAAHRLSDMAFAYVAVDGDLRVLDWPAPFARAIGIGREQAVGTPLTELFHLDRAVISPSNDPSASKRAFLDGEMVLASARGKQVLLQHVVDLVPKPPGYRRHVLATVLGDVNGSENGADEDGISRLLAVLRDTSDAILLVRASTLSVVEISRGARESLGHGSDPIESLSLQDLSHDLAATVQRRFEYLQLGSALSVCCTVATRDMGTTRATAHVRLWDLDYAGLLVIRLRGLGEGVPDGVAPMAVRTRTGEQPPAVGTILVNRHGAYQVLTSTNLMRQIELDGGFGGSSLPDLTCDADATRSVIERGFDGRAGNVHLAPSGHHMVCALSPLKDDAGTVVALTGVLNPISA